MARVPPPDPKGRDRSPIRKLCLEDRIVTMFLSSRLNHHIMDFYNSVPWTELRDPRKIRCKTIHFNRLMKTHNNQSHKNLHGI